MSEQTVSKTAPHSSLLLLFHVWPAVSPFDSFYFVIHISHSLLPSSILSLVLSPIDKSSVLKIGEKSLNTKKNSPWFFMFFFQKLLLNINSCIHAEIVTRFLTLILLLVAMNDCCTVVLLCVVVHQTPRAAVLIIKSPSSLIWTANNFLLLCFPSFPSLAFIFFLSLFNQEATALFFLSFSASLYFLSRFDWWTLIAVLLLSLTHIPPAAATACSSNRTVCCGTWFLPQHITHTEGYECSTHTDTRRDREVQLDPGNCFYTCYCFWWSGNKRLRRLIHHPVVYQSVWYKLFPF